MEHGFTSVLSILHRLSPTTVEGAAWLYKRELRPGGGPAIDLHPHDDERAPPSTSSIPSHTSTPGRVEEGARSFASGADSGVVGDVGGMEAMIGSLAMRFRRDAVWSRIRGAVLM